MRVSLATRITISIVGVLVLAVVSSFIALLAGRETDRLLENMVAENLPSVRTAVELEIAFLEQRGLVASHILDGGRSEWLQELDELQARFPVLLARAEETAITDKERVILARIKDVYRAYDAKRDEALSLFEAGETEKAKRVLLHDVKLLYDEASAACEEFIDANQNYIDATTVLASRQVDRITLIVVISVVLTLVTGSILLWLFFDSVLRPLRHMAAAARAFSIGTEGDIPKDELRAVGFMLKALMSDVQTTRTSLKRSQAQLVNAEKLASVGKLAAGVAHEIRNPLTAMKMWLFSIRKAVQDDPELDRKVSVISEEIGRLETIVRNFLEFSRPPEVQLQPHSLDSLIAPAVELMERRLVEKRLHLEFNSAGPSVNVLADAHQFRQVLINLINNACDATPDGGDVELTTAVELDKDGRRMGVVRLRDTGCGVPPEIQARMFEPFLTTKEDGTGLGLCIAAQIMSQHGGRLVLESTSPSGSTFSIWIPIAA